MGQHYGSLCVYSVTSCFCMKITLRWSAEIQTEIPLLSSTQNLNILIEAGCLLYLHSFKLFILVKTYPVIKCITGYITGHGCGHIAVRLLPLHQATRVSRTEEDSYQKDDHRGQSILVTYIIQSFYIL